MLEDSSVELKTLVLLEFTKRLIISKNPIEFLIKKERELSKTSNKGDKTKISEFVEKIKAQQGHPLGKAHQSHPLGKNKIPEYSKEPEIQKSRPQGGARQIPTQRPINNTPILRISETRLPPQFAYLNPYATNEVELDLGKLNPLLADPAVNVIESNNPDQGVIVKGRMGTKPTSIILSKEEIDQIIQIFSKKSKIPAGEGAVKIALGRYILSAIISEEAGSRFIITKLPPAQRKR